MRIDFQFRQVLKLSIFSIIFAGICSSPLSAAVLPEDRADVLYHSYTGDGVSIDGPSILVRKAVLDNVSVSANYYVDSITSASVDVVARASEYTEERTEYKVGADYLHNKTLINGGYTKSEENDFIAETFHIGVSQDFFGDLSTLSLGYSRGNDTVGKTGDPNFSEEVDRHTYRLDWTQVLTKNWIANATVNIITDQGYLNNPYRAVRYLDENSDNQLGYSYQNEVYPETRTSTAFAVRSAYFFSYRAALHNEYRFFTDTWKINAHNIEIKYVQPITLPFDFFSSAIVDLKFRYYTQTAADFYADMFPYRDAQNFLARDKEMSQFSTFTFGLGLEFELDLGLKDFLKRSTLNVFWDFNHYDYENFRNVNVNNGLTGDDRFLNGTEPLFNFSANVLRVYFSVWY